MLAYVGCIAGAVPIAEYVAGLKAAGFAAVEVVDTKKDLNAYSEVEGQGGCCAPPAASPDNVPAAGGCCGPTGCTTGPADASAVHGGLAALLAKYDVNEFAASVQVYAVKPAAG
jgi:hypothetical protein